MYMFFFFFTWCRSSQTIYVCLSRMLKMSLIWHGRHEGVYEENDLIWPNYLIKIVFSEILFSVLSSRFIHPDALLSTVYQQHGLQQEGNSWCMLTVIKSVCVCVCVCVWKGSFPGGKSVKPESAERSLFNVPLFTHSLVLMKAWPHRLMPIASLSASLTLNPFVIV